MPPILLKIPCYIAPVPLYSYPLLCPYYGPTSVTIPSLSHLCFIVSMYIYLPCVTVPHLSPCHPVTFLFHCVHVCSSVPCYCPTSLLPCHSCRIPVLFYPFQCAYSNILSSAAITFALSLLKCPCLDAPALYPCSMGLSLFHT